ncbi:hypothetical protein PGTUg99_014009 [Puccinia graminis f. sp. tritici]|uniref:RING-type domain-containing protein n=1 Tax=Puccinia graminis f. sp. tritici TaxID=56615 RepID=A0A5B0R6M3_PUCGR|nr:hypothetical protein PGTUg99_014009 [Puccinia graminis f. sp. tritici]
MNPSCPHPLGPPPSVLPEASPTPSAGLYNFEDGYDYISEPNENLVCPICRNPFIEPVMCESTDHIFCQSCLIKSLEVSATCPIDRLPLSLSLIVPAPKIINKLVDELLVSCPFKAKLGCSFVCQRDLIQTHIHSHQAQLDQLASDESLYPQVHGSSQNAPLLDSTVFQRSRLGLTSPKSCLLRFQWLENRATLVSKPQSQIQIDSGPDSASNQPKLSPCPFERFGCSFMGTPEAITQQHLSVTSDSTISTDEPRFLGSAGSTHFRPGQTQDQLPTTVAFPAVWRHPFTSDHARLLWSRVSTSGLDTVPTGDPRSLCIVRGTVSRTLSGGQSDPSLE